MKVVSTASTFTGGLTPGFYLGTISMVSEVTTKAKNGAWSDESVQEKIEITTDSGKATKFLHTKGFKKLDALTIADMPLADQKVIKALPADKQPQAFLKLRDQRFESRSSEKGSENYAVNIETDTRVEDAEKTAVAQRIAGEFLAACGVAEGEDADTFDMEGREVGIEIRSASNNAGKAYNDVYRFLTVEAVQAKIDAELANA